MKALRHVSFLLHIVNNLFNLLLICKEFKVLGIINGEREKKAQCAN